MDAAIRLRRDLRVVGDEHERRALHLAQLDGQLERRTAGGAVEVAGGFVGQQERGARRKRTGKRHALLLAAGELARVVAEALGEPDLPQHPPGARVGIGGWSYGGFMAAYALTHSKAFRVGIAGAGVYD